MAKHKHTPGPWKEWEEGDSIYIAGNPDGRIGGMRKLAYMIDTWAGHQTASNARLIAAAPSLLEALEELMRQADISLDYRPEFRRAIASASTALALALAKEQA